MQKKTKREVGRCADYLRNDIVPMELMFQCSQNLWVVFDFINRNIFVTDDESNMEMHTKRPGVFAVRTRKSHVTLRRNLSHNPELDHIWSDEHKFSPENVATLMEFAQHNL